MSKPKTQSSEESVKLWNALQKLLKPSLSALLRGVIPVKLTQETLILSYNRDNSFTKFMLNDQKNINMLNTAVQNYLGRLIEIVIMPPDDIIPAIPLFVTSYDQENYKQPESKLTSNEQRVIIHNLVELSTQNNVAREKPTNAQNDTNALEEHQEIEEQRQAFQQIEKNEFREKYPPTHRTEDGHLVRSKAEALIDNWLYHAGIVHAYERKIPIKENVYSDFYLPKGNAYIEYWGLQEPKYLRRKGEKIAIYKKYKLSLIEIENKEISNIDDILPKKLLQFGINFI
jgi:hypothetical protein